MAPNRRFIKRKLLKAHQPGNAQASSRDRYRSLGIWLCTACLSSFRETFNRVGRSRSALKLVVRFLSGRARDTQCVCMCVPIEFECILKLGHLHRDRINASALNSPSLDC